MGGGTTDPEALERELERLPEVRAARVVAGTAGRIVEVHLVTDGTKAPKQLTRDVETVAATQGIDLDRRTISIAQMPEGAHGEAPALSLVSLAIAVEGAHATCRVRVRRADTDALGEAGATSSASARPRLVATATLAAVSSLAEPPLAADIAYASVDERGGHRIALVVMTCTDQESRERTVAGIHPAPAGDDDAIARAVLDAIDRAQRG